MVRSMRRLLAGIGFAGLLVVPGFAADPTWTADQVLERLIARSKDAQPEGGLRWHQCRRVTTTEELDEKGNVTRTKTRELHVVSTNGVETVRPWKAGDATPEPDEDEEVALEEKGKSRDRAKSKADRKEKKESKELGEEIFRKFQYTLEGEEILRGRTNFVLRFTGKPGATGGDMGERLLRLFEGRMWVDATDFELSKVDAHLGRKFDVLGGIAATIQKLDFQMERQPIGDGIWETGLVATEIQGRKVLSSMRSRYRMEQDRFVGGRKPSGGSTAPGGQP